MKFKAVGGGDRIFTGGRRSSHGKSRLARCDQQSGLADEITLKKQMQQEARRTGNKQLELELTIEIIN